MNPYMQQELQAIEVHKKAQKGQTQVGTCTCGAPCASDRVCTKCGKRQGKSMPSEKAAPSDPDAEEAEVEGLDGNNPLVADDSEKLAGWFERNAVPPIIRRLPRGAQNPAAASVVLGSLYAGNEGRKFFKTARAAGANPVLSIRRAGWKSMLPSEALKQLAQKAKIR